MPASALKFDKGKHVKRHRVGHGNSRELFQRSELQSPPAASRLGGFESLPSRAALAMAVSCASPVQEHERRRPFSPPLAFQNYTSIPAQRLSGSRPLWSARSSAPASR